ncbi:hypothetical protein DCAR_0521875 [Daucus carota subsp. sativus]|uniref:ATP-dependent DNA helicase n=1 Tax=Daucus carota subsp. sativus TaxID=79200 RepID=A0AAF0X635_DAUCS|nr:hypothetical protein DCAR_0521875 [Daucus carota subsp. sativus]
MTPHLGGRLFQQYIVDAFSTIEQARLWYIRTHQTTLRSDLYSQLCDSLRSGNTDASRVGKGIILPAGFVGSRRYMQQNFQDALAVCRYIGHPDIFLTMTTNPLWDEINEMMKLLPHCLPQNSPDIIARVFKLKLDQLVDEIKNKEFFGKCIGVMYVVEFQKRGLPHVHMLIWLSSDSKKYLQANICCHTRSIKYIFKYCLKGHDRATVEIKSRKKDTAESSKDSPVDEINQYFDGRYICACEAAYRIFGFNIHYRTHSVQRLSFHLPGERSCVQIGRLFYTNHSSGELWYLRLLLTKVRGPTSFKDLRTVNGKLCQTFQEACKEYGLLDDDNEWHQVLQQCSSCGLAPQIRELFVHIMVNCRVTDLKKLWNDHSVHMTDDIVLIRRKLPKSIGKSLNDFNDMPQPPRNYLDCGLNNLIIEETSYNLDLMAEEHKSLISEMNEEQLQVYNAIMDSLQKTDGGFFFVYGSGGCGKTYLWKTLISKLRSESLIVLPVASSGIAATLLPGGRTAHSRFKIPIMLDDCSTCNIAQQSDIAQLLHQHYNDPKYLSERAILTPTNNTVAHVNALIVDRIPGESQSYYSVDNAEDYPGTETELNNSFPPEFLNSLNVPVGVVVMLMRNLNQTLGLCNGTRMMVTKLLPQCVQCEVISGSFLGTRHFIPRMELFPTDSKLPYKLMRKQMPLQICYAMTINKSQGQSLEKVGLYLPKPVFSHGQLYVAISRVTSPEGLRIFVESQMGLTTNITANVVYKEFYKGDETYRAVRSGKHIYFNTDTLCSKVVDTCLKIQPLSFDLYCLDDVYALKKDNRFLIGEFLDSYISMQSVTYPLKLIMEKKSNLLLFIW